jgi:hypothetical protein
MFLPAPSSKSESYNSRLPKVVSTWKASIQGPRLGYSMSTNKVDPDRDACESHFSVAAGKRRPH